MPFTPKPPARTIVVASYNIHSCVGADRLRDPARVAEVIRELDADIVALQEVDAEHGVGLDSDQWHYLSTATGHACIPGISLRTHRRTFGNALLTRRPALAVRLHDLSVTACEPRGAIEADIAVGSGLVRVIATHFGLGRRERRRQAEIVAAILADGVTEARASLVLGDLNEWRPGAGSLLPLLQHCQRAPTPRSFPARHPLLTLDRVLVSGAARLANVAAHASPLARRASDHLPVTGSLAWLPERSA